MAAGVAFSREGWNTTDIPYHLAVTAAAWVAYIIGLAAVFRTRRGAVRKWQPLWIFVAATLARLPCIPTTPPRSTDPWRSVWEGRLNLYGLNPFRLPPEDPSLEWLRTDTYEHINNKHLTSVYGTPSQAVFALAAWIKEDDIPTLKLLLILLDLGAVALLMGVLIALKRPPEWALAYAWNPLILAEFALNGHQDVIGIFWLCAALLATVRMTGAPRARMVGLLLAMSVASKGYTLLLVPLFLRHLGRRWRLCMLSGAITLAALTIPYLNAGHHALEGFQAYGAQWERNAGIYRGIASAYERWGLDEAAAASRAKWISAVCLLLLLGVRTWRQRANDIDQLFESSLLMLALFLLLSPTVYPWYVAWVMPFLCFRLSAGCLLFSGLVVIEYLYNFDLFTLDWFGRLVVSAPAWLQWLFHTWHPYDEDEMLWLRLIQHVPVSTVFLVEWARGFPLAARWQGEPPVPTATASRDSGECPAAADSVPVLHGVDRQTPE